MIFANDMTFLLFFSSLGELQYLNLESNSLDHLPKNLLHKNVHKKLLDVRLSYNKLRIVDTNTFSSLKVKFMDQERLVLERRAAIPDNQRILRTKHDEICS